MPRGERSAGQRRTMMKTKTRAPNRPTKTMRSKAQIRACSKRSTGAKYGSGKPSCLSRKRCPHGGYSSKKNKKKKPQRGGKSDGCQRITREVSPRDGHSSLERVRQTRPGLNRWTPAPTVPPGFEREGNEGRKTGVGALWETRT